MLTHAQVWSAIDRLAARAGLSASGLARRAGPRSDDIQQIKAHHAAGPRALALDRIDRQGARRDRHAVRHFRRADRAEQPARRRAPCRFLASPRPAPAVISTTAAFRPAKAGTRSRSPPSTTSTLMRSKSPASRWSRPIATAMSSLVSPSAPIRRGDRVVVRTRGGEVMAKELKRRTAKSIELKSLNAQHADRTLATVRRAVDRPHFVGEPVIRPSAPARRRSCRRCSVMP